MKVLQAYRDLFPDPPGGIERHVFQLAHGLKETFDVDVLIGARRPRSSVTVEDGVTVIRAAELARLGGIPMCPSYPMYMRRGYDIVHLHSPNPTAETSYLLASKRTRGVATYHADIDRGARWLPLYGRLLLASLGRCSAVLVTSSRLIGSSPILSALERKGTRLEVVPPAVDLDRYRPPAAPHRDGPRPRPRVLFVGRLRYYKGVDVLIEAVSGLDVDLWLVGDGPERDRIVGMGRERLGDRFRLLGEVAENDLPEIFRSSDVFCLPSLSHAEAFGMAALEAMACGVPVITTEVGTATSRLNVDGSTGLVVPPGDARSLREALEGLLSDRERLASMGAAARARAEDFSVAAMIEKVSKIYLDIIG